MPADRIDHVTRDSPADGRVRRDGPAQRGKLGDQLLENGAKARFGLRIATLDFRTLAPGFDQQVDRPVLAVKAPVRQASAERRLHHFAPTGHGFSSRQPSARQRPSRSTASSGTALSMWPPISR